MATAQNAATQFVTASDGVRYAYRQIGSSAGIPLIMHTFFRSNMDFWDPLLVNSLADKRPVILFDQAGVGRSTGTVPTTYQGWADSQIAFTNALGLKTFDVAGYSMGGLAAQMVALTAPHLVRKLILLGTRAFVPGDNSDVGGIVWPGEQPPPEPLALSTTAGNSPEEIKQVMAVGYFCDNEAGHEAFDGWWSRINERKVKGESLLLEFLNAEGTQRQLDAATQALTPNLTDQFDRLKTLKMPVLVMVGDTDVIIPTSYSWELAVKIPGAQLITYPRSSHGFLDQYPDLVASHMNLFLDGFGNLDAASRA